MTSSTGKRPGGSSTSGKTARRRDYARGRLLDAFAYTGGFALTLGRASGSVVAVESSAEALRLARRNQELNGLTNVEWKVRSEASSAAPPLGS